MDHLPHPQDAAFPPVRVPYYSKFQYDCGNFSNYPSRCGFDKSEWQWGNFSSIPSEDHTAFFQAWLFFGVLFEFFGGDVDLAQFIDRDNGVIATAALPKAAQKWQKSLPTFGKKDRFREFERVNLCLQEMRDLVIVLDGVKRDGKTNFSEVSEEVCLSIIALGLTLEEVKNYRSSYLPADAEEGLAHLVGAWPTSRFARKRLEAGGLCKSAAGRLERYIFSTGMIYCGSMKAFGRHVDHSSCLENACAAEDVDETTYKTAHTKDCSESDCEHTGVTGQLLEESGKILESGNFPIISLTKAKGSSEIKIGVEPWKKSISYTAFTHVWADGLGNPHANTLPECQYPRLYSLLEMLSTHTEGLSLGRNAWSRFSKKETVYLWIDTLCIPREHRLRKLAINRMYSVYDKATKVLLLDESLLNISSSRPLEELCFRITMSPWMRRAWTLQEGALASTLFIQFSDGPIHAETAMETMARRTNGPEVYNITLMESCITLRYLQACRLGEDETQVTTVHSGLIDRSTTHHKDKELCMAIMLGCDMVLIQEAKGEERTKRLYEQMAYLPDSFFWHRNACLNVSGFKWAPKDLWSTRASGSMSKNRLKMRDGRLTVQAPGMVYRARSHYVKKPAPHMRDWKTGKWYNLRWHEGEVFEDTASKSTTGWTVLAILLKSSARNTPIKEGVVLSLEWAWDAQSLQEMSEMLHSRKVVEGTFVGRAQFEELDQEDTATLSARAKGHGDLEDVREEIRTGKTDVEYAVSQLGENFRQMLLEDDDDWWVFSGEMMDEGTVWSVE